MIELLVKHNFEVLSPVYKGRWTWIRLYVQGFHCKLLLTVAGQQQIKKPQLCMFLCENQVLVF